VLIIWLYAAVSICQYLWHIQRGCGVTALSTWSGREFLDNFCCVFVSLISRLNCKIRVSRLPVTVRVFCLWKTVSNCTQTYNFGDRFFSGEGPSPLHRTPPPWRLQLLTPPYWNPKYATGQHFVTFIFCIFVVSELDDPIELPVLRQPSSQLGDFVFPDESRATGNVNGQFGLSCINYYLLVNYYSTSTMWNIILQLNKDAESIEIRSFSISFYCC